MMREKMRSVWCILAVAMVLPVIVVSQARTQRLVVNGYSGSVPLRRIDGRNYVDLEALTQLVNGSLSFNGNQIILTLTTGSEAANATKKNGLSPDFLRAAIEEMTTIREWHTALAGAIQNQNPVIHDVLGPYEVQATKNLRLAQVAAKTDADQHAAQLVTNEFQKMKQLSDSYLAKRAEATYINADALTNDTLNQSVIACGRALAAMAANGQFSDDGSCR